MFNQVETAVQENILPEEEVASDNGCCHHWIIETPDGPNSKGHCKLCGAERVFANLPPQLIKGVFLPRRRFGNQQ